MRSRKQSKVVVIGPLPPPTHGHMVFTERILGSTRLAEEFDMLHVDVSDHRGVHNIGRLDFMNVFLAIKHAFRLALVLVRERPSVVYVPLAQNVLGLGRDLLFVVLSLINRVSVVTHVHGGGFAKFLATSFWPFRVPARALLRRSAAIVVMSDSQKEDVESVLATRRVRVVPHGTERLEAPPRHATTRPLCALYICSSLRAEKGLNTVLAAAVLAQEAGATREWNIVGQWRSADTRRQCEATLAGVPGIRFSGELSRDDIFEAYRSADVFVFPTSPVEGFGLVRIEAMAAGLPVVTTEAGGARSTIRDGIDGFIVDYDSPSQIVDRLEQLRANPAHRIEMGQSAQRRQRTSFSVEAFETAIAGVWREAIAAV